MVRQNGVYLAAIIDGRYRRQHREAAGHPSNHFLTSAFTDAKARLVLFFSWLGAATGICNGAALLWAIAMARRGPASTLGESHSPQSIACRG